MNTVGEMVVRVGVDTTQLDAGLARGQSKMQGFAAGMGKMSNAMALGVSLPIAAIGVAVTKMAMTFETEMTDVFTLMDDATIASKDWKQEVLDLSKKVPQSTSVLAKGLYNIVSAGIDASKAMTVLATASKAATAGLADTDVAVTAITAVLNAYGLEAEEAENISDTLFTTVKYGVTTFPALAGAIGRVVSTASAAGVSFEEVGASLITMTKAGISTDEAVTALNQVILTFLKPTDQAVDAAAAIGFELDAVTLSTKGLGGAMAELVGKLGISVEALVELEKQGYSDEEMWDALAVKTGVSAEIFATIFSNVRALKGALALASDEGRNFAEAQENMTAKAGEMSAAFEKQAETTAFAFDLAMSSLKAAGIELGQKFLPAATKLFDALGKGADKLSSLDDATIDSMISWAGLLAILPLVGIAVSKTITGVLKLKAAMAGLAGMQIAPWLGTIVTLLPNIGTAAGLMALKINDTSAQWGKQQAVVEKLKGAYGGFFSNFSYLFDEVAMSVKQLSDSELRDLNDAFLAGKLSAEAYSDAVLYLSDRKANLGLGTELAARATEDEIEVLDQIIKGTYELAFLTDEMAASTAENTVEILKYKYANEELIGVLQQVEADTMQGIVSAEDYERAVAFLANTNGQYQGTVQELYAELKILTKEQLGSEGATKDQTAAIDALRESFNKLIKDIFGGITTYNDFQESGWAVEEAEKALAEAIKEFGEGSKEALKAQNELDDANIQAIQTAFELSTSIKATADEQEEAKKRAIELGLEYIKTGEIGVEEFNTMAEGFGLSGKDIMTYAAEMGIVIDKETRARLIEIDANKEKAQEKLDETLGTLFKMDGVEFVPIINADNKPAEEIMEETGVKLYTLVDGEYVPVIKADPAPANTKIKEVTEDLDNLDKKVTEPLITVDISEATKNIETVGKALDELLKKSANFMLNWKDTGELTETPGYKKPEILEFAYGGRVPGPIGVPMAAIVHGGEEIINPYKPSSLDNFLKQPQNSNSGQEITNKFEIAELIVREEADIGKVAKKLLDLQKDASIGGGFK